MRTRKREKKGVATRRTSLMANSQIGGEILPYGEVLELLVVVDDEALFVGKMEKADEAERC